MITNDKSGILGLVAGAMCIGFLLFSINKDAIVHLERFLLWGTAEVEVATVKKIEYSTSRTRKGRVKIENRRFNRVVYRYCSGGRMHVGSIDTVEDVAVGQMLKIAYDRNNPSDPVLAVKVKDVILSCCFAIVVDLLAVYGFFKGTTYLTSIFSNARRSRARNETARKLPNAYTSANTR